MRSRSKVEVRLRGSLSARSAMVRSETPLSLRARPLFCLGDFRIVGSACIL
jgi:hypothetical protein